MDIPLDFDDRPDGKIFTCPREGCERSYTKFAWWRRHVTECCFRCRCGKFYDSKLKLLVHAALEHSDLAGHYVMMAYPWYNTVDSAEYCSWYVSSSSVYHFSQSIADCVTTYKNPLSYFISKIANKTAKINSIRKTHSSQKNIVLSRSHAVGID